MCYSGLSSVTSNVTQTGMSTAPIRYKLRNWRRQQGLTQAEAAKRFGVARRTWHQWEQGAIIPGPSHMIELVNITGGEVQPNDFYALPALTMAEAA